LGRGGEAGKAVSIEDDALLELPAEAVALGVEAIVVVLKVVKPLTNV
jgi:hypothetical protein